jgi:signal transduction histidine kinase
MVITALMLYLYHFTGGAAFALKVPTVLNLFCVQGLAALRFQRGLALYAGGLAVGLYLIVILVVVQAPDTVFGSPIEHTQSASISPLYLLYNLIYLFVFSLLIYFLVVNVRRLVVLRVKETQAAMQAKERALVAAGVAHEIKNPLGGIYGAAQLLKEEGKGNSRFIEIILKDSVRLNEVVQQFLRFSRPFLPQMSAFDLVRSVREFVQGENTVQGPGELVLKTEESNLQVFADPEGLRQILLNLTQNARRYHPAGKPVMVRVRSEGEVALIEVEDEGEGVLDEHRSKLFEPFFTTAVKGTGLGLAISRKVSREMGGNLYYEPKDSGSRFVVVLKTPDTYTAEDDEYDPEG